MAMVLDAVVGAVVGELLSAIIKMKARAGKFKPTLERLETTLKSIEPLINQIDELNQKLNRPAEETEKLIIHMKNGKELVLKCSDKVNWWNCCYKSQYQEKIQELDEQIRRFFELDMRAQDTGNGLETLMEIREVHAILRNERLDIGGVSSPALLKHFRPYLERGLNTSMKRIEQTTATMAATDYWLLGFVPTTTTTTTTSSYTNLTKLSSSANKFNSMIQDLFQNLAPLEALQLEGLALEGLYQLFSFYVNLLIKALPVSAADENLNGSGNKIVKVAETERQQIALLSNAMLLADELLPCAVSKLSHSTKGDDDSVRRESEQRELKKRLQREVHRLRDSFCRQHELLLNAQMYLSMEESLERSEWFPSPIFRHSFSLIYSDHFLCYCSGAFEKLTRFTGIASDMSVGRERFATILSRLVETVVLWLSDDQAFWEGIETGLTPLGPLGLQQLNLDMKFVMLFSSQGRYLSHYLRQAIKNITDRAIDAVAATGIDPNSVLPEDDWFVEVSEITIKMITEKASNL